MDYHTDDGAARSDRSGHPQHFPVMPIRVVEAPSVHEPVVDELVNTAFTAGGAPAMDPVDHGFMYAWSFYDPDGHHWEVLWVA